MQHRVAHRLQKLRRKVLLVKREVTLRHRDAPMHDPIGSPCSTAVYLGHFGALANSGADVRLVVDHRPPGIVPRHVRWEGDRGGCRHVPWWVALGVGAIPRVCVLRMLGMRRLAWYEAWRDGVLGRRHRWRSVGGYGGCRGMRRRGKT